MGSADHRFNLAELLSQNYSLREGCAEATQCPDKPEDQLDKDFITQVWSLTSLIQLLPLVSMWSIPVHMWFAWCCTGLALEPALLPRTLAGAQACLSPWWSECSCSAPWDLLRGVKGSWQWRSAGLRHNPRLKPPHGSGLFPQSSDMPLDELLALYGYEASDPISEQESEGGDAAPTLLDMTLDKVSGSVPERAPGSHWLP